jgi:flagellar P-ring protein FlgI
MTIAARSGVVLLVIMAILTLAPPQASALRLKELCEIQGARPHILRGIGVVVGLAGTGDKAQDAIARQERLLERLDVDAATVSDLVADNMAVVIVDAVFPPFAKEGTRIDVRVNCLYDSDSLEGGTLLETHLYSIDKKARVIAQGAVSVGGFNADAGGANVRKNHVTVGRVPGGGYIEREIPSTITDGQRLTLALRRPDFTTANSIREAIDARYGDGAALALGAGAVRVTIPAEERPDLVGFVSGLLDIDAEADLPSRVVVNERTGTIVVGGDVLIRPCQVAHGSLTIQVARTPLVSQPEAPFTAGETVVGEATSLNAAEEKAYLMPVEGTSASDVAQALNQLKVTPRDMIAIFQALERAGALQGELEIM